MHAPFGRLRTIPSLLLSLVALGGCGGGGGTAVEPAVEAVEIGESLDGSSPRAIALVRITATDLPDTVRVGQVVRFRVTASLRTPGTAPTVSVRLQNPPPGCTCAPVTAPADSATAEGRWIVTASSIGAQRLAVRAETSAGVFRKTFDVTVVGAGGQGDGVLVGDVTGDGRLDVVALASAAGADDAGALFVYAGATTPSSAPTATLRDPAASPNDGLGKLRGPSVQLADVTGDAILDVVVAVPRSDRGASDAGAVLVWAGGPALAGTPAPTCVLVSSTPVADAMLGWASRRDVVSDGSPDGEVLGGGNVAVTCADVLGSPARDVLVLASNDDGDAVDAGAVYVFEGGAALTSGPAGATRTESARLVPPTGLGVRFLGACAVPLRIGDLTGDGRDDVVAATSGRRMFVWAGGAAMVGPRVPTAALEVRDPAIATPGDFGGRADAFDLADVDGDGTVDLVACSRAVTVDTTPLPGVGCVWLGGTGLAGAPAPDAVLRGSSDVADGQGAAGMVLRDLDADGRADVLVPAPGALGGAGELRLWRGASFPSSAPAPVRLRQPAGTIGGSLGLNLRLLEAGLAFGDVTGDGVDDVLAVASGARVGTADAAGQVVLYRGGTDLEVAGDTVLSPFATLRGEALPSLRRGSVASHGLQTEDLDGDGVHDVVVASLAGAFGAGRVECWRGGPAAFSGIDAPDRVFDVPLPDTNAEVVTLADLTADGRADLAILTRMATASGPCVRIADGATVFTAVLAERAFTTAEALVGVQPGLRGIPTPLLVGDVTGDGRLDGVGADTSSARSGTASGCVYLWNPATLGAGTSNPSGRPTLVIRGRATAGSGLPGRDHGGQGLRLADLSGDGVLEVIVSDPTANAGDGEIGFVRGVPTLPTNTTGLTGTLRGPVDADGLTR